MKKRSYTHVQVLLPEIKAMLAEGKTQREVAEHYGFREKQVVKRLLARERRKERELEAGFSMTTASWPIRAGHSRRSTWSWTPFVWR